MHNRIGKKVSEAFYVSSKLLRYARTKLHRVSKVCSLEVPRPQLKKPQIIKETKLKHKRMSTVFSDIKNWPSYPKEKEVLKSHEGNC